MDIIFHGNTAINLKYDGQSIIDWIDDTLEDEVEPVMCDRYLYANVTKTELDAAIEKEYPEVKRNRHREICVWETEQRIKRELKTVKGN